MARRLAAIMFTDIAGYTALSERDEPAALRLLRDQERLVRGLLEVHRGRWVKSIGDGLLIEFANSLDAVECGVDIQRHIRERNAREPPPELRVRIGLHLGDVEEVGADILGDAVNVASRIEPLAEPGGVCLSEPIYGLVRSKVPYQFESLGPKTLKGVSTPIEVYRVTVPWADGGTIPPTPHVGPPRLAVLPLTNIGHDPENEYFAEGLTEELITVLSQIKGLRVISRTSVNQYKGTTKPVAQIGVELGATSVLEGSVRKSGEKLRIAIQLIDAGSDEHRWAQTYDRKLEDVFAIQADLAERTARALQVELLRSEREGIQERPTSSFAAYEAYLRGIQASQRSGIYATSELDREAVAHFETAIRDDPRFAAAYARLAHHLIVMGGGTRTWAEVKEKAPGLISRALELDPHSSEAHLARGNLLYQVGRDWEGAEAEFQQAIALNPSDAMARNWYASLLVTVQRHGEARKQLLAAIEQDPLNIEHRVFFVNIHWATGDLATAAALLDQLVKDFPVHPNAWSQEGLALVYAWTGRRAEALRMIEPLAAATDVNSRLYHARFMALLGSPEEARRLVAEWEAGGLAELLVGDFGELCACMGDYPRALSLMERAERKEEPTLGFHYQDPEFDAIRDDPRFIALLKSEHLPTSLARPRWRIPSPPE